MSQPATLQALNTNFVATATYIAVKRLPTNEPPATLISALGRANGSFKDMESKAG